MKRQGDEGTERLNDQNGQAIQNAFQKVKGLNGSLNLETENCNLETDTRNKKLESLKIETRNAET